jgi:glucan phosphoethanolaminetransferase (alkaline phosphatase superfamily)
MAYDIGFYTGRGAGSTYSLGELDGTYQGMLRLAPQAIVVSLFRPFLWEVRNPLMLLSALESLIIAIFTLYFIFKTRFRIFGRILKDPVALSFMIFAIGFAFAVGVSTYNFGTLSRYRIPLLPMYLIALVITHTIYYSSGRNVSTAEQNNNP